MTKTLEGTKKAMKAKVPTNSPKLKESGKRKPQITFATAQKKYGLVAGDLQYLGLPASEKPWDRKYDTEELKYIAAKKKAFEKNCKIEGEAKKAAEESAKIKEREQEQQAGVNFLKKWQEKRKLTDLKPQSDSKLPADIWIKILKLMSTDLELNGVRGPSVIARDLCNVSRVNKELYIASLPAFEHLSSLCKPIQTEIQLETRSPYCSSVPQDIDNLWAMLITEPTSLKTGQLNSMLSAFQIHGTWSKVVTTHKLLQQLGINRPTRYPACILIAVRQEKHQKDWHVSSLYSRATEEALPFPLTTFAVRKHCVKDGFATSSALVAAADARDPFDDDNNQQGQVDYEIHDAMFAFDDEFGYNGYESSEISID